MRGASWRTIRLWRPRTYRHPCRSLWALSSGKRAFGNPQSRERRCQNTAASQLALSSLQHVSSISGQASSRTQHEELHAILGRAPHGIDSINRIEFESDLGHRRGQGTKLADLPVNRQDLDLWLVLLEYRILKHGARGIQDILYGMKFRGTSVKLLEYDDASDRVWDLCLAAAPNNLDIVYMICDPKGSIGRDRATLFLDVIEALLKAKKLRQAEIAATLLRKSHFRGRQDLIKLFDLVLDERSVTTLDDFCTMYHCLPFAGIYADVVPALCKAGRVDEALKLHTFLLKHSDFPKAFGHIELLIRQLAQHNRPLKPFLLELEHFGLSFSAQSRQFYNQVTAFQSGTTAEAISLSGSSMRQRRLNDQFAARVFATHALSFEFGLKSLKFFGLVEVGPLAIREMALSASSLEILRRRFKMLEDLEVDTGSTTFVTVVRNLCNADAAVLLKAVLDSDQHHDVFEDRETQKRLLAEYLYKNDWPQVNRTLAILNRGKIGVAEQQKAKHLLLKSAIIIRDWRGVLTQLADIARQSHKDMMGSDQDHTSLALDFAIDIILAKGKRANPRDKTYLDRVQYLIGLLQNLEFCGISVGAKHWRRVLFRLGELSWFDKLENLTLWLASYYGKRSLMPSSSSHESLPADRPCHLSDLFDTRFQATVMQWSICKLPQDTYVSKPNHQERRGARLLYVLRKKCNITANREDVRDLFRSRLDTSLPSGKLNEYMEIFDRVWALEMSERVARKPLQQTYTSPLFPKAVAME